MHKLLIFFNYDVNEIYTHHDMNVTLFLLIHTVILFILHLQVLQDSGKIKNTFGGGSLYLKET